MYIYDVLNTINKNGETENYKFFILFKLKIVNEILNYVLNSKFLSKRRPYQNP